MSDAAPSTVSCRRCGESRAGLPRAPLPGDIGADLLAGTCQVCWQDWMGEQTKLINEESLTPLNPDHYKRIVEVMRDYLELKEESV